MKIYFDTETTGIKSDDQILELAIIDGDKNVLFHEFFKPSVKDSWPQAERVHGISPDNVKHCHNVLTYKEEILNIFDEAEDIFRFFNN